MEKLTSKGFDLLRAILSNDPVEAEEKLETLWQIIINFLRLRDKGEFKDHYEDLTIKVLLTLAKHLQDEKIIKTNVESLARGMAKNLLFDFYRERKKEVKVIIDPIKSETGEIIEPSYIDDPLIKAAEIEKDIQFEKKLDCLRVCLDEVCKNDLEKNNLLNYYDQENQKLHERRKEIAESLGISTVTLKTRMCRLRDKLRECIEKCIGKV